MLCRKASDSWVCAANARINKTFLTPSYKKLNIFFSYSKNFFLYRESETYFVLKVFICTFAPEK